MATEKRLIDANELAEELADDRDQDCNRYQYWYQKEERDAKYNFAIDRVNEAPTVDAVEVVRCGKCKWYNPEFEVCEFWHSARHPEHFCGEGERKDNGQHK